VTAGLLLVGMLLFKPAVPDAGHLVFNWISLFLLGIVTFQFRAGLQSRGEYLTWVAGLGAVAWFMNGAPVAVTGTVTALLIAFVELRNRVLAFFGTISYSLYLTHVPVGGRVDNLLGRFANTPVERVLVVFLAMAVAVAFAAGFYWLVERPAVRWAASFSYRARKKIGGPAGEKTFDAGSVAGGVVP
jgi:peptidoglycan/LPS O-acetylase OafA/YrhL